VKKEKEQLNYTKLTSWNGTANFTDCTAIRHICLNKSAVFTHGHGLSDVANTKHFRHSAAVSELLNPVHTTQPVFKPVEQPAASYKQTFSRLSNRLFDRSDNRLYHVNGVLMLKIFSTW